MATVTNYIVKCSSVDFVERYVLPEHRDYMNRIIEVAEEREYEPLLVIGRDGMWWSDDLSFILDRMSDGDTAAVNTVCEHIEANPLKEGETYSFMLNGATCTIKADTTPMDRDGWLTNDCEMIEPLI